MLKLLTALLVVCVALGWAAGKPERRAPVALGLVLFACLLFPITLIRGAEVRHIGIASASPSLPLILTILVAMLAYLPRSVGAWRAIAPLAIWCFVGGWLYWPHSPEVQAGLVQILGGCAAWAVGFRTGALMKGPSNSRDSSVYILAAALVLEAGVVIAQYLGFQLNSLPPAQQELLSGRFNGTVGHPNDLGKLVVFSFVLLLVLARDTPSRRIKNVALIGHSAAVVTVTLTEGRVVIACVVVATILWAIMQPREVASLSRRFGVLLAASLVVVLSASIVIARFAADPDGGIRAVSRQIAREQISREPVLGSGPNSYISTVGAWNSLTASGIPVHDSSLLIAAELGLVGLVALGVPLLVVVLTSLPRIHSQGPLGAASIGVVVLAVVTCMIAATGWGLIGSTVLPMFLFSAGLLRGLSAARTLTSPHAERQSMSQRLNMSGAR